MSDTTETGTATSSGESTTTSSESTLSTAGAGTGGSGGDGGGAGSQAGADAFAAERTRLEQRARDEQSRADRLQSEVEKLTKPAASSTEATTGMTPAQFREEMRRARELERAASDLRKDETVKYADPSLYDRIDDFDSVEALRAAAEQSHRSFEARLQGLEVVPKSDVEQKLAAYEAKYGPLQTPPASTGTGQATGDLTIEQVGAMGFDERDAYEAAHPGVIARVVNANLRST